MRAEIHHALPERLAILVTVPVRAARTGGTIVRTNNTISSSLAARRRVLLALALVGVALIPAAVPARADGTAAGTVISNTATATYADPNSPGTTLNATSNTVSVTVAEVAGITVTGLGATDTAGGSNVLPGHLVNYDYKVTNIGNDPTGFFIPSAATITGPGTAGTIQISYDNGTTWTNVTGAGMTTTSVVATGSVRVRVPVTINANAATGATVAVLLGNTGANDNSPGTQNQPFPTAPAGNDLYTQDVADGGAAGEINGAPVNGEREASATQQVTIGSQPQAFALLLLTHAPVTPGVNATQDVITYNLGLNVNATVPSGALPSLSAADMVATTITLGGSSASRILIAQAIPSLTNLTGVPTAPAGWTVVYTTSPTTTTANNASWATTAPADLTTVTRVGFVAAGPISKGTNLTGFQLKVVTSGASANSSTQINAIAQVFGQTNGDSTNALVYDESGDQDPSNFNDDGSRGSNVPTNGVANPASDGVDTNNNNTGTGVGGEDNILTITPPGTILNGPNGQPGAVGPTDNNDDFTNQSTPVPAGTAPGSTIAPGAVIYNNTFNNPSASAIASNVYIIPMAPTVSPGGAATDLPTGTTVTIRLGASTATYTYNGAVFNLTGGAAVSQAGLSAGASVNYTVTVQLPNGTPLSTDTGKGFPVPVAAFIDANGNGSYDAGEPDNITIDRTYTGFLKVTKQAQIVDTDGATVIQPYTTAPTTANIRPGRYIDYLITYTNISSANAGTNNVILNAGSVVITEDGTTAPNNWALDQDGNGIIDTSNVVGTAVDSGAGATITFFSGNPATTPSGDQTGTTAGTDVTKYVDTIAGTIAPGVSRSFKYRRKFN